MAEGSGGTTVTTFSSSAGTPGTRTPRQGGSPPSAAASCQPWKWPSILTTRSRPVEARATWRASIVASVPLLVNRTSSAEGTSPHTRSAHSASSSCDEPACSSRWAARLTASTIAGGLWPSSSAPWPMT